jgi:hypothetical protein
MNIIYSYSTKTSPVHSVKPIDRSAICLYLCYKTGKEIRARINSRESTLLGSLKKYDIKRYIYIYIYIYISRHKNL